MGWRWGDGDRSFDRIAIRWMIGVGNMGKMGTIGTWGRWGIIGVLMGSW
jgi:hypothetical protein